MTALLERLHPVRQARSCGVLLVTASILLGMLALPACSSSKSAKSQFEISTQEGQVSLSLDGKLPPGWPANVPVPPGAEAAGSGSLVANSKGAMVGVYKTAQSAEDVYGYYTGDSSIVVDSKSALGSGTRFVGHLHMTSPVDATVIVLPHDSSTLITIVMTKVGSTSGDHAPTHVPSHLA